MNTVILIVVAVVGTFTGTWLGLRTWERHTQRLITRMQNEAWRAWTDEWDGES